MKEVRSQFHRVSLNDIPLDQGNPDDSLIAVIYNSPADYTYNNFLYGLGTNNGGIYIESWGTFFTYERTPQESIYTLEDLFRHEFSHYLQGRYMAPGMWGQDPIYDNQRLTWFEEGGAEFMAGSSRLNGIQTRLTMVDRIAQNESDRMTLAEVVNATYGNWEFYRYGFAFFDYMYKYQMGMLLEMVEFVKTGDGDSFDILMDEIANDDLLNDLYQAHMDSLKSNQNNFTDPVTSSLYFEEIENIPTEDIINEISSISQIQNISSETYLSSDHNLLSINGDITLETNNDSDSLWLSMNSNLNNVLASLDAINWNGYNTVNGWFSNPELNTNNQWVYRLDFQCKTSNDLFVANDVSPKVFALHQNYPNPFNPITSFRYELPEQSHVTIVIYDMLGREVRTLVNTTQDAGFKLVIWNATNDYGKPVSAGVYLYQINAGDFVQTKKMVLLK